MKKFLLKGPYTFEIRNRHENPYFETAKEFQSLFDALQFLRGFLLDRSSMASLREVLANDLTGRSPAGLTDYEVIEQLARRFASGQLCVVARHDRFPPGTGGGGAFKATLRPPPAAAPSPPAMVDGPPPLPGPSAAAAAAQAQALQQAAESGAHFCEA